MSQTRIVVNSLEEFIQDTMTRLTLECVSELQRTPPLGTPVDTGWARANWIPNIGSPIDEPQGTPESPPIGEQEAAVARVISTYRLPLTIFISNNVPYITRLNEGSSAQSPAGFVQEAIARAIREVS